MGNITSALLEDSLSSLEEKTKEADIGSAVRAYKHNIKGRLQKFLARADYAEIREPVLKEFEDLSIIISDALSEFNGCSEKYASSIYSLKEAYVGLAKKMACSFTGELRDKLYAPIKLIKKDIRQIESIISGENKKGHYSMQEIIKTTISDIEKMIPDSEKVHVKLGGNIEGSVEFMVYGYMHEMELLLYNAVLNGIEAVKRHIPPLNGSGYLAIELACVPSMDYLKLSIETPTVISPENVDKIKKSIPFSSKNECENVCGKGMGIINYICKKNQINMVVESDQKKTRFVFGISCGHSEEPKQIDSFPFAYNIYRSLPVPRPVELAEKNALPPAQ
jgi:hypothetical protein